MTTTTTTTTTTTYNLWCHVVRSTTKRPCVVVIVDILLAHAEVSHFDVTVFVQQNVIEFQVPANVTAVYNNRPCIYANQPPLSKTKLRR